MNVPVLCFVFGLVMAQWTETCRRIFNIDYQYMLCLLTEWITILLQNTMGWLISNYVQEDSSLSRILPTSVLCVHMVSYLLIYCTRESIWNPNSNTLKPDRRHHDRPSACYRSAVFFRHISLIALLVPEGKIKRTFQNYKYFN
jgi:hypothetical protein